MRLSSVQESGKVHPILLGAHGWVLATARQHLEGRLNHYLVVLPYSMPPTLRRLMVSLQPISVRPRRLHTCW